MGRDRTLKPEDSRLAIVSPGRQKVIVRRGVERSR